ncbi:unnamed protein product [Prorocentrum cordatum]|uniref:Solute carrier family 40 protein n=1 Tax=Prorocentrum cordatum TaxID=2364126 RepID=A0ABN9WCR4_9DINO|nr:unnamed protein product [Polarella glacialis]
MAAAPQAIEGTAAVLFGTSGFTGQDPDDLKENLFNMNSTVALLSALLMSFTFSNDFVALDLGEGFPDPICAGWTGYQSESGNLRFQDDCSECINIWQSCDTCAIMAGIFQILMQITTICAGLSVSYSCGMIFNFSSLPKVKIPAYNERIGWRVSGGRILMNAALGTFFAAVAIKFSLVLEVWKFAVSLAGALLASLFYLVIDWQGRADLSAVLAEASTAGSSAAQAWEG